MASSNPVDSRRSASRRALPDDPTNSIVEVFTEPPELSPLKQKFEVKAKDFRSRPPKKTRKKRGQHEPFLLLGFDTEYQTPATPMSLKDVRTGKAKYKVLSYQFYAKTDSSLDGWDGICCPPDGERLSMAEFLVFALGKGLKDGCITEIPTRIYLVGHFTRADFCAFSDFRTMTSFLANIRNTFINLDQCKSLNIFFPDNPEPVMLFVFVRDSLLLAPAGEKSLSAIGNLMGDPKLSLEDLGTMGEMERLRHDYWERFKSYALKDAKLCVKYLEHVMQRYYDATGTRKIPITLSSIGMDLLVKTWKDKFDLTAKAVLGQEEVKSKIFSKRTGRSSVKTQTVPFVNVDHWITLATECYHGGRNEQFWFGPGYEADWLDYDLSSAYPTAMAFMQMPLWDQLHQSTDPTEYHFTDYGFAHLDFEFPKSLRFPTIPVRTAYGLVFPRRGTSHCAAAEIALALKLGAKIKIHLGIIIPADRPPIFAPFISECLAKRSEAKRAGSRIDELFWKELTNSTYGKTAQGLRPKRVYDVRSDESQQLPPSKITNPFFAASITSFVRAVLGAMINALPAHVCVFSCTTDGFLTDATPADIEFAESSPIADFYGEIRKRLSGAKTILEVKHSIRKPLGWRTRGQATLISGVRTDGDADKKNDFFTVLAKGGIFLRGEDGVKLSVDDQNEKIVSLFVNRTPDSTVEVRSHVSVRDMFTHEADFVELSAINRLSMEFDYKRIPLAAGDVELRPGVSHLAFSTRPLEDVQEFTDVRTTWEVYRNKTLHVLKTKADFDNWIRFLNTHYSLPKESRSYLRKKDPDLALLRQSIARAYRQSKAGFDYEKSVWKNPKFARMVQTAGLIDFKKADIENGLKVEFQPHLVPKNSRTILVLENLAKMVPSMNKDIFFTEAASAQHHFEIQPVEGCLFLSRF